MRTLYSTREEEFKVSNENNSNNNGMENELRNSIRTLKSSREKEFKESNENNSSNNVWKYKIQ